MGSPHVSCGSKENVKMIRTLFNHSLEVFKDRNFSDDGSEVVSWSHSIDTFSNPCMNIVSDYESVGFACTHIVMLQCARGVTGGLL